MNLRRRLGWSKAQSQLWSVDAGIALRCILAYGSSGEFIGFRGLQE